MHFEIKNTARGVHDIMRTIGYRPAYFQKPGEFSIVRPLGRNDYPRFHLYIRPSGGPGNDSRLTFEGNGGSDQLVTLTFNLHLDQKKPSYEGATGHSGDYDGPAVEGEAERIKQLLNA